MSYNNEAVNSEEQRRIQKAEHERQAAMLRGRYVHAIKGKFLRRHRRAGLRFVPPQMIFGEVHFPTVVVSSSPARDQIMGGHVTQIPANKI